MIAGPGEKECLDYLKSLLVLILDMSVFGLVSRCTTVPLTAAQVAAGSATYKSFFHLIETDTPVSLLETWQVIDQRGELEGAGVSYDLFVVCWFVVH